jgi:predicted metal-dependent hydrolase
MIPTAFSQAIGEFQRQDFYACHDTLEALWIEALEPEKQFYQGVLQVAVACYHLENHNQRGAVMLLGEGVRRLRDYQPEFSGIDVDRLMATSLALLGQLQQLAVQDDVDQGGAGMDFPLPDVQWIDSSGKGNSSAEKGI